MKTESMLFAVLVVTALYVVDSAYFVPGYCPEGHTEGDLWTKGCTHCQCLSNGYACGGCSSAMTPVQPGCTKSPYNYSLPYPDCCPQHIC